MSEGQEVASAPSGIALEGDSVVVVSPVHVTEACFLVPAVRALGNARPDLQLVILSPESFASLWDSLPGVRTVVTYPDAASSRQIAKIVQDSECYPDSALLWEHSEAAVALAKVKVNQRIGYDLKPLTKRLTATVELEQSPGPIEHRVRYYVNLVERLGIEGYVASSFATPPLPPRPSLVRIGLVPGSIHGPSYQWGVDRFFELGKTLLARHQVELVTLAYPGQAREANELDRLFEGTVKNFANEFDLGGLLGALPHCSFLVANDGAVMHLAAHVGLPTVALFGAGDPVAARPLGRQHTVLSEYAACSPCHQEQCPLDHHRCMGDLSVARVYEAVRRLL